VRAASSGQPKRVVDRELGGAFPHRGFSPASVPAFPAPSPARSGHRRLRGRSCGNSGAVRRLRFLAAHRLKTSLWFVPAMCVLAGVVLSYVTISIDRAAGGELVSRTLTGDPNAALIILSTVAASMVSLTALVLTITMVVVQLAMGQFSPRAVRPFLRDRPSQFAIGIFAGTFAHAMLAMREVRSFTDQGSVPGLTILVSFALVIVSIIVLVAYVHHIGNSLKVDSIIKSVGEEARGLIDKLYPELHDEQGTEQPGAISSDTAGLVFRVDHEALVDIAAKGGCRLELVRGVGEFVPRDAPLLRVHGNGVRPDVTAARRAVSIGPERTMDQDGAFGIQTLVDVAQRSLTDSFNDPTTAVQALDRIHDCMRQLATRRLPDGRFRDAAGELRFTMPALTWEGYVALAFDSLRSHAEDAPPVLERMRDALEDIRSIAPAERRPPLDERIRSLERPVDEPPSQKPTVMLTEPTHEPPGSRVQH
jgi:uncharacterized membrane protein